MILVTGGAGYIGSHCVLGLLQNGFDVLIFDSLENGHIEIIEILKNIDTKGRVVDFIQGDLKNTQAIRKVFQKHKSIDTVAHFAAYSDIAESIKAHEKYYLNNVYGSMNLFKAMLENNVKKLVFSSSAAVYGEAQYTPIDESHPKNPATPYGQTKLMVEKILKDYDTACQFKSITLRYFNVVGADKESRIGEWHEPETHLIPCILKSAFSDNKSFELFGYDYNTKDGTCIRDYVDIEDLINAHILAIEYIEKGGQTTFINIGTGIGNSVKEVFGICQKVTGTTIHVNKQPKRAGDSAVLIADNKKAQKILNWLPNFSLEDSIFSAFEWEKKLNNI